MSNKFDILFNKIKDNIKMKDKDSLLSNIEKLNDIDDINEFNENDIMNYLLSSNNYEFDNIFIDKYKYMPKREFFNKLNIIKNPSTRYERLIYCLNSGPESIFKDDIYLYYKILFERFVKLGKEKEAKIAIEKMVL